MPVQHEKSIERLMDVHPDLRRVVNRAHDILEGLNEGAIGFIVTEGMRTPQKQAELVAVGASQTMQSKHLPQSTGFSHAVDLAAVIGNGVRWDWPLYYTLAAVVRMAAIAEGVNLRWGGVWDTDLDQLPETPEGMEDAVREYQERTINRKKYQFPNEPKRWTAFVDGPHFELGEKRMTA